MSDQIRVYLVDDHAILREGIRALLERDPALHILGEASDGETALGQLARWKEQQHPLPDVMLLDIGLPGMNGIELTRKVKQSYPEIRVLILSMHDNQEYVRSALQLGADGYVLKRLAGKELSSAIQAVANGHTLLHPDLSQILLTGQPPQESLPDDPSTTRQETGEKPSSSLSPSELLTGRELEVLRLIASGYTNARIADVLHISIKTVQAHRSNLMQKLDIHDALELTKYALRHGLIKLED